MRRPHVPTCAWPRSSSRSALGSTSKASPELVRPVLKDFCAVASSVKCSECFGTQKISHNLPNFGGRVHHPTGRRALRCAPAPRLSPRSARFRSQPPHAPITPPATAAQCHSSQTGQQLGGCNHHAMGCNAEPQRPLTVRSDQRKRAPPRGRGAFGRESSSRSVIHTRLGVWFCSPCYNFVCYRFGHIFCSFPFPKFDTTSHFPFTSCDFSGQIAPHASQPLRCLAPPLAPQALR